jgi:AraC family transcriptional regulator of arabinose operon
MRISPAEPKRRAGYRRNLLRLEKDLAATLPQIHSMGTMLFDPVWAERVHDSQCCELLHVIRGTVRLEIGHSVFQAGPGGTLLVPPGTKHRDRFNLDEGLEVFFCSFTWPGHSPYLAVVGNADLLRLPEPQKAETGILFDQLRSDRGGLAEGDRLVTRVRLLTVLLLLLRGVVAADKGTAAPGAGRQALMRRAKAYLEGNYTKPVTLDRIAGALRVSSYHLSHVFSAESDFSLFHYLTLLRMNRAKLHLGEGRMNIAEVARAVGYENANYFSKVFRRHVGCAPREFAGHVRR